MDFVKIETTREGYAPDQIESTLTIKELIERLQEFDEELPVMFSNDNGYTYGGIREWSIQQKYYNENEE